MGVLTDFDPWAAIGRRRHVAANSVPAAKAAKVAKERWPLASVAANEGGDASQGGWSPDCWRLWFDERAAIREHDGGMTRDDAEAAAFEECVTAWLNQNPPPRPINPDECVACSETARSPDALTALIGGAPFPLHAACAASFLQARWAQGVETMRALLARDDHA